MEGAIIFVGALVLIAIICALFSISAKVKAAGSADVTFIKMLGERPKHYHFYDSTGIAISRDAKQVALIQYTKKAVYDASLIRGHRMSYVEADRIYDGSVQAAVVNMKLKSDAAAETGLFVQVKDIENPEWRISMPVKKDQAKWHEILTQFYEGEL